jgi:hypothetical protein
MAPENIRPKEKPKIILQIISPAPIINPIFKKLAMKEKSFFVMKTVDVKPITRRAVTYAAVSIAPWKKLSAIKRIGTKTMASATTKSPKPKY